MGNVKDNNNKLKPIDIIVGLIGTILLFGLGLTLFWLILINLASVYCG